MSAPAYQAVKAAWWNTTTFPDGTTPTLNDVHVDLITKPETDDPRKSEGLLKYKQVEGNQSLYILANRAGDLRNDLLMKVAQSIFRKGGVAQVDTRPTPYGWASDFDDVQDTHAVYASKPQIEASTQIFWPVNDGSFNYGVFKVSLDPQSSIVHAAQADISTATGNLPPDLASGYTGAAQTTGDQPAEFSVMGRRTLFVALSPAESAAQDGPHPGVSIINPGAWKRYQGTARWDADALGLGAFVQRGWRGIGDRPILAYQGGTSVSSAGQELGSAMEAAERGDRKALDALGRVGITYHPSPIQRAEDFLGW